MGTVSFRGTNLCSASAVRNCRWNPELTGNTLAVSIDGVLLPFAESYGGSCIADLTFLRVSLRAGATEAVSLKFSRERMSRIEFLQASRFLWGVSVEQNKRGSYTGSPLGSNIRKACTQIISNNNAMDAESILSARVTVLTDITFGPSL